MTSDVLWLPETMRNNTDMMKQITEYLDGTREQFDFPLAATGTSFQKSVWEACRQIPYGETRTYKDIARMINNPNAVRAVGTALSRNPFPIIIPCHRVIPSTGGIGSYAYGAERKAWLLRREQSPHDMSRA